jgi:hypothetical protein
MAARMRWLLLFAIALAGCDLQTDSPDGGTSCGSQTCSSTQVCAYRDCTDKEKCVVSAQCPTNTTPTTCDGQPGCLLSKCGPIVVGCRAVPAACTASDVQCACTSICANAGGCSKIDGRNVDCVSAPP